jgi:hypothetical protein
MPHVEQDAPRDAGAALADFMSKHCLTIESVFVPYSRSRNAKPRPGQDKAWPSLNWTCTLAIKGRPILTADYSAGAGHAPGAKATPFALGLHTAHLSESVARQRVIEWELENGRPGRFMGGEIMPVGLKSKSALKPVPVDVLSSLAMDSDAIDAGGFESWAGDLGYDTDSRTAESTYRQCVDIGLKLRAALGDAALAELQALAREL